MNIRVLDLTDSNRTFLKKIYSLSTDLSDREVLVGLTHEESERYLALSDPVRNATPEEMQEHSALKERHILTRVQVLEAELCLRTENPSVH